MSDVSDERKAEVLRLHYVENLSVRAIAKRLSMARRTVRRLVGVERRPARPPVTPRPSILEAFEEVIRAELVRVPELRAPAMLERLRPLGYTGGVSILRDRMRALRPRPHPKAFSSFSTRPGERLEVDWANLGYLLPGVPRTVSAFVAVLVHSRMLYVDFALSQQMGAFLRCLDRALLFFGGRTAVDVFDNMKTVVIGRVRETPIFHSRMIEYARVRGFAIIATRPATPTDKPFVERGIGFLRTRFLPGRHYADFADLRLQGNVWRDTFANGREHQETGRVPALVFEHEEKPVLAPLRDASFDSDDLITTTVGRTHRVHFDRNDYTVPWRLVGQTVLVRGDDEVARVFLSSKEVARHNRSWAVRELVEDKRHEDGMRQERARPAGVLPDALAQLGEVGARYFAILAATSRSLRIETIRLVLLCELFGAAATSSAIADVMQTGHVGADYVEYVIRHKRRLAPSATPLRLGNPALDAIVVPEPDLAVYDEICARPTRDPGEPPAAPIERSP
jgi:transposase